MVLALGRALDGPARPGDGQRFEERRSGAMQRDGVVSDARGVVRGGGVIERRLTAIAVVLRVILGGVHRRRVIVMMMLVGRRAVVMMLVVRVVVGVVDDRAVRAVRVVVGVEREVEARQHLDGQEPQQARRDGVPATASLCVSPPPEHARRSVRCRWATGSTSAHDRVPLPHLTGLNRTITMGVRRALA